MLKKAETGSVLMLQLKVKVWRSELDGVDVHVYFNSVFKSVQDIWHTLIFQK